jgi:PST family polysaccharide transporter
MANLFEVIDRYMIIHHSGMDDIEALRQVGYYHSSRIVPLLFVAVAGLLGLMITPHLSFDWEQGRREAVVRRLNTVLKLLFFSLFSASVAMLFVAPLLFEVAFQNKFQGGLQVLPWTLTYCTWFGAVCVAQNYLWCAERPGLCSFALLVGVLLNIGVNLVLLPRYGLEGAVWSTTLANFTALLLVYLFSRAHGMRIDPGTWILSCVPAVLGLGSWISLGVLVAVTLAILLSDRVLDGDEKAHLLETAQHGLENFKRRLGLDPEPAADIADTV